VPGPPEIVSPAIATVALSLTVTTEPDLAPSSVAGPKPGLLCPTMSVEVTEPSAGVFREKTGKKSERGGAGSIERIPL